jgi:gliding motility-associated-like protein
MVSLDFSIYDRWGNRIFRTTSINDGWDGTNKGLPSPNGNYVWTLRGIDIFGKKIEEKGNFVLIR